MTPGFEVFIGFLATIGTAVFLVAEWRGGKLSGKGLQAQTAADTINVLQQSVNAFKDELAQANAKIALQHDDIIRLQEALKHKDDEIKRYLDIIANRNPDLEKTLGDVRGFLEMLNKKIGNANSLIIDAAHTAQ